MSFERIASSVDVPAMRRSHVLCIGGAQQLMTDLVRCGLGSLTHVDFDSVSASNPRRQDYDQKDVGRRKIEVARHRVRAIDRAVSFSGLARDFCSLNREEMDDLCRGVDLVVGATDFFPAQARCGLEATARGIPFISIGLYAGGKGGEVFWSDSRLTCPRCALRPRFEAFVRGAEPVSSAGGTIMDLHLVDAIAAQIAVGLLTRGSDNRFGRLIDELGDRQLLLVKIDPGLRFGDRDPFTERLGADPCNFSFTTIALARTPHPDCPDCAMTRGRRCPG